MDNKIDFVIIWVDGNDPKWQACKDKYSNNRKGDRRNIRFREWDNLQYWFRGVEKFAPWVNKIHFVTWGHIPKWLNTKNPKLNIVKHSDFIPKEYLPTFSSHVIELNLHRIKGLSEQFVYFNDDTFITNYIKPTVFFKNGKPCDMAVLNPALGEDELFISVLNNDALLINRNFKIKSILKNNFFKYFNIKYGKYNIRTLLCCFWSKILGFYEPHHANAFLKTTFKKVWQKEYEILNKTCLDKFRSASNVNQYVFKWWQFCEGNFIPHRNLKKLYNIFLNIDSSCEAISNQKYPLICLNDSDSDEETFIYAKEKIKKSFDKILPEKSSFEK